MKSLSKTFSSSNPSSLKWLASIGFRLSLSTNSSIIFSPPQSTATFKGIMLRPYKGTKSEGSISSPTLVINSSPFSCSSSIVFPKSSVFLYAKAYLSNWIWTCSLSLFLLSLYFSINLSSEITVPIISFTSAKSFTDISSLSNKSQISSGVISDFSQSYYIKSLEQFWAFIISSNIMLLLYGHLSSHKNNI